MQLINQIFSNFLTDLEERGLPLFFCMLSTGCTAFKGPLLLTTSDLFFSLFLTSVIAMDFSFLPSGFAVSAEIIFQHAIQLSTSNIRMII